MPEKVLQVASTITVGELAEKVGLPVTKVVGELFKNGIVATVNQRIDFETAQIIVDELELDVELQQKDETASPAETKRALTDKAQARPPIVAVMGHVDHGKTTLLDAILGSKVAGGEAGGITQHISAYQAVRSDRPITFLDTPGHEAFSALRQHGAALTDVVIIVVAADDGVKPQTVEAIKFAKSANARIIVAINKIDKETADPNRTKAELAENGLQTEEWGGDVTMVEVSAKTGQNIDKLLDMVLLVSDLEELKAEVDIPAEGLVIESHMETGRGPVVSLLVEHGELKLGQFVVAGSTYGKVRTEEDYAGNKLGLAGPATPLTMTGFKQVPAFGDRFVVVKNEREARNQSSTNRQEADQAAAQANVTGSDLLKMMNKQRDTQEVNVIVKADVQGSLTSLLDSLKLLATDEVNIRIVSSGVGNVTESDISRANGSSAVIYGFNVSLPSAVKRSAARENVEVRIFDVIYQLIDDAKALMEDVLEPEVVETQIGQLKLLAVFRTTKSAVICGGEVLNGKVMPGVMARVKRGEEVLAETEVSHVQRQQQEAKEVFEGEQCGLELKTESKLLLEAGDRLEFFTRELKQRSL
ncbi:MAG TPA: translation initiation factor IF-2 [Candidatus Saccharimonadales bacterium]|nr:translation initiation factor IF-2 [Candidatus Saccharimonadales bacterium]